VHHDRVTEVVESNDPHVGQPNESLTDCNRVGDQGALLSSASNTVRLAGPPSFDLDRVATVPRSDRTTLQLKVQLRNVTPLVWRRLLVPAELRLSTLADVLIGAMGWNGAHLHCFYFGDTRYGPDSPDLIDMGEIDESTVALSDALDGSSRFTFEYDFGDDWRHRIDVERVLLAPIGLKVPVCVAGKNACPPDDCGGAPGYEILLEALADSSHEEHDSMFEWVGGVSLDPTEFDIVAANIVLQHT
jgi:hypothetical protein